MIQGCEVEVFSVGAGSRSCPMLFVTPLEASVSQRTAQSACIDPAHPSERPAGEYPIADLGSRTLTGSGLIENRSGVSITWVSPSRPIAIGEPDEISKIGGRVLRQDVAAERDRTDLNAHPAGTST